MEIKEIDIENLYEKLYKEAENSGYHLNPDINFTKELIRGLLVNEIRYGYWACPCRLASGKKENDLDIICPCDYRDADLLEFGNCYCALYVSSEVIEGKKQIRSIPERRKHLQAENAVNDSKIKSISLTVPIYRCKVCGYLCAREQPPEVCPICKAKKERFEKFIS